MDHTTRWRKLCPCLLHTHTHTCAQAHTEAVSQRVEELNSFTWNVAGKGGGILQNLTFPIIFLVMKPGYMG